MAILIYKNEQICLFFAQKTAIFMTMSKATKDFIHFSEFNNLVLITDSFPVYGIRAWLEQTINNPYVISKTDYVDFMTPPSIKKLGGMTVPFSELSLSDTYAIIFANSDDLVIVKLALENLTRNELAELFDNER